MLGIASGRSTTKDTPTQAVMNDVLIDTEQRG